MPIKLKKIFEKEYMNKGFSKKRADNIFYGFEAKRGHTYPHKINPHPVSILKGGITRRKS